MQAVLVKNPQLTRDVYSFIQMTTVRKNIKKIQVQLRDEPVAKFQLFEWWLLERKFYIAIHHMARWLQIFVLRSLAFVLDTRCPEFQSLMCLRIFFFHVVTTEKKTINKLYIAFYKLTYWYKGYDAHLMEEGPMFKSQLRT